MTDEEQSPPPPDLSLLADIPGLEPMKEPEVGTGAPSASEAAPSNAPTEEGSPELSSEPALELASSFEVPADLPLGAQPPLSEAAVLSAESDPSASPELPPPPNPPVPNPMDPVKALSENLPLSQAPIEAGYPFSLLIEGPLNAHERAKLLDILASENLGVREVDLEPQFESSRVLIPRISEYAGVLIVQALRGTSAELRLGPSDEIFSTAETRETLSIPRLEGEGRSLYVSPTEGEDGQPPAERIPLTPDGEIPGRKTIAVVDLITATRGLEIPVVEAEKSREYQEALEALTRELKYKAYVKGANAIVNFTIQLSPLRYSSQYRLTVLGSAVKLLES